MTIQSKYQFTKLLTAVFIVGVIWISPASAAQSSQPTDPNILYKTALYPQSIQHGVTIGTPDQTFLLGVHANSIAERDHIDVRIRKITDKEKYQKKKNRIVGPIWKYTLSHKDGVEVKQSLWVSFAPKKFEEGYTVARWDDTMGKWIRIPYTVSSQGRIQTALPSPDAKVAVLQKIKKRSSGELFTGKASWYNAEGAAMNVLPLGTHIVVKNPANGKEASTIVTSTGPFVEGRIIDLPRSVFEQIGDLSQGVLTVIVTKQ